MPSIELSLKFEFGMELYIVNNEILEWNIIGNLGGVTETYRVRR